MDIWTVTCPHLGCYMSSTLPSSWKNCVTPSLPATVQLWWGFPSWGSYSMRVPSQTTTFPATEIGSSWAAVWTRASQSPFLELLMPKFGGRVFCSPFPFKSWSRSFHQPCPQLCRMSWHDSDPQRESRYEVQSRVTAEPRFLLISLQFCGHPSQHVLLKTCWCLS